MYYHKRYDRTRDQERRDRERKYDREYDRERYYEREKNRKSDRDRGYNRRDERREGSNVRSSDHCSNLPSAYSDDSKVNRTIGHHHRKSSGERHRNRGSSSSSRPSCGDWAECKSSSGKKYYYNSVTGVSQWERPKEFIIDNDEDGIPDDRDMSDDNTEQNALKEGKLSTPESFRTVVSCDSIDSKKRLHDSTPENHASDGSIDDDNRVANKYESSSSTYHKDRRSSSMRSSSHYHRESEEKYRDHSNNAWTSDRGRDEGKNSESKSEHHHYQQTSHHLQSRSLDLRIESSNLLNRDPRSDDNRDPRPNNRVNRQTSSNSIENDDKRIGDIDLSTVSTVPTDRNASSPALSNRNSVVANTSTSAASDLLSPSQININNLPKLISQLPNTPGLPDLSKLPPQEAIRIIQQALQLTRQVHQRSANQQLQRQTSNSPMPSTPVQNHGPIKESPSNSSFQSRQYPTSHSGNISHQHSSHQSRHYHQQSHQNQSRHHNSSLSNHHQSQHNYGHYESADGIRHELDLLANKNWTQSPGSDASVDSPTRGPSSSISSIPSGIGSNPLKPPLPTLTPSLANYYNENLIQHTVNWTSEQIEKQIKKFAEEAHNIGSLNSTRVSAELKMARSLVRLTEIQATLQEQRILYIRHQIKEVEEWKGQSNNFASHS